MRHPRWISQATIDQTRGENKPIPSFMCGFEVGTARDAACPTYDRLAPVRRSIIESQASSRTSECNERRSGPHTHQCVLLRWLEPPLCTTHILVVMGPRLRGDDEVMRPAEPTASL